tara:strand:+ start:225 stop:605 length:381 start_codon:yes stop_codon:yes gene_type:complete
MIIEKLKEGYIDVPIISKENTIKRGLYLMIFKGSIIKVGVYGEGVNSTNKSRFCAYRNKGKDIKPGNGSYKTMKVLNENLNISDQIEVRFIQLPDDKIIDGYRWKVDLYHEEKKYKEIYKDSLWLN